jgi:oxaloacetate decarboxylase gamma subunit|tara:strand:+ start:89 stop:322 length:234 start_codon:yes stop_codon:yes gene_type:complete
MDNNLLTDAITLTMFGMGFVFVFLALMVVVTSLMSKVVTKIQPAINVASSMNTDSSIEIDEKTRAIIEAAIKMHTQR